MLERIKEKSTFKKVIAVVVAAIVVIQSIVTIAVTESFLDTEKFSQSERADKLVSSPLSSQEHIDWLKAKGEAVKTDDEHSAISVINNSTSHSYMLIFHPLTQTTEDMAAYAMHFYEIGFNVIIPDYIGKGFSMGFKEKDTVESWVEYVAEQDENANIFIFGVGVGATASLLSTQSEAAATVKGVISDSAYCDLKEVFSENIKDVYGVSSFPTVQLASLYIRLTRDWSVSHTDIQEVVKNSEIPILYIHGTEDSVVPVGQSNELYEVTRAEGTAHFTIHGAEHAQALNTDSEKYWRKVDEFIRNCL